MSAKDSPRYESGSAGPVTGAAMIGLLVAAAGAAWLVGGSMPGRQLFPGLLTLIALALALATPYRWVRMSLLAVSPRLRSDD
jgi:hypothetical protein